MPTATWNRSGAATAADPVDSRARTGRLRELATIDDVDAAGWNRLAGTTCPFLRHEFLAALEHSGCVGPGTGWTPAHHVLYEGDRLVAAAPVYRKDHSWGEFVFDFAWARAWTQAGHAYYPKLTCAVPFSPVGGARLLTVPGHDAAGLREALAAGLEATVARDGLSSAHALFVDEAERDCLAGRGWLLRRDVQFHWSNPGYHDFQHYLAGFTAEKRKKVRRERRRCSEAGITFRTLHGPQIDDPTLACVHALHALTFLRHGHEPYLNLACFTRLRDTLGDALMVKLACHDGQIVGAAVFLRSHDTLYGRYWGASDNFHSLHFEACYHQGIEYCIEHGLSRFEPGTQGEHKVARGFVPRFTWSAHHIAHPGLRAAVADYLQREERAVQHYAREVDLHTPFQKP